MSDPHARALAVLDYLTTTNLDVVASSAWQEVRQALLEAQAQHHALLEEVRALRIQASPVGPSCVVGHGMPWRLENSSKSPDGAGPSELLGLLGLLPDVPLALEPGSDREADRS